MEPSIPIVENHKPSNFKPLIIILVVVVLIGAGWFFKGSIQSKPVTAKFVPDAEHAEANLKEITAAHLLTGKDIKITRSSSSKGDDGTSITTLIYTSTTPVSEMATLYRYLLPPSQYTVSGQSIKNTQIIIAEKAGLSIGIYLKSTSTSGTEVTLIYEKK